MKKVLFFAVCAAFSLSFWMSRADAQMCEHMGECMQGGMMGGMQYRGMEMMHERRSGMMGGEGHIWKCLAGLNLSDQQKEALKAIRSKVMKEAIRKSADMRIAALEQKDLLDKDPVDMKAVEAKLRQIESLRTDIHLLFIKGLEEIKSKLTPEQKKNFMEKIEKGPMMGMGMGMMQYGSMEEEMSPTPEEKGK